MHVSLFAVRHKICALATPGGEQNFWLNKIFIENLVNTYFRKFCII